MRLLVLTSYFTPYVSGLSLYVDRMSRVLVRLGHNVTVLTNRHDMKLPEVELARGVRILRTKINFWISKSPISVQMVKGLIKQVASSELIIVNLPALEGVPAALLARVLRKKILAIHHCDPVVPGKIGFFITFSAVAVNFFICLLADRIVTYTIDYASSSPVLKWFGRKIVSILPPIEAAKSDGRKEQEIADKIGGVKYVFGFAGRFSADKGVRYLLEAIPLIKLPKDDFKIIIAGPLRPVGENYFDELRSLRDRYKQQLVFLGAINPNDMSNFYKCIDCLILPSINRTESFGMVQAEALMSGVPVISSDIPGVRWCVRKTGGGLIVEPKRPDLLASAMVKIVTNRKAYKPKNLDVFSLSRFKQSFKGLLEVL